MLHVSRFRPDPSVTGEFLACLWQGEVPASLRLHTWLYVDGQPREMLLVWEGDRVALDFVRRAFGDFGELRTEVVSDATPGLAACLARDLDGFAAWLVRPGAPAAEVERQLDVRRRGLEAATRDEARAAGRAWGAESPGT